MIRYLSIFLSCIFLFSSCAVRYKSLSRIQEWPYPQNQFDKQFDFSYVDHVLEKTNNKQLARWAKRKNIHVISIRLINNSNFPIHGTQISFFNGDEEAEIIHNNWLAKKVRQRISPFMILFIPVFLVEAALFHKDDDNTDDFYRSAYNPEPSYISEDIANQAEQKRVQANFDLRNEMLSFQLANQILEPGKVIYGVVGIRCKGVLDNLHVVANDSDFKVLSTNKYYK